MQPPGLLRQRLREAPWSDRDGVRLSTFGLPPAQRTSQSTLNKLKLMCAFTRFSSFSSLGRIYNSPDTKSHLQSRTTELRVDLIPLFINNYPPPGDPYLLINPSSKSTRPNLHVVVSAQDQPTST